MKSALRQISGSAATYLIVAVFLTWAGWVPAAIISSSNPVAARLLQYAGGIGLVMATAVFVYLGGPVSKAAYMVRLRRARFGRLQWGLTAAVPLAVTGAAVLLDCVLGNASAFEPVIQQLTSPATLVPTAFFLLLFGPLPEELSWRGLGLPLLRRHHEPLTATLVLGCVWVIWHLPLFWLDGSYQSELGVLTRAFWLYLIAAFATTFLYTWIWEQTHATLAAIALHFFINFTGEMFQPSVFADTVRTGIYVALAALLALRWVRLSRARNDVTLFV